jgi:purine-binding chemotaxis protein CheW
MTKTVLSDSIEAEAYERSGVERRQKDDGPPGGIERRVSNADRRTENNVKYLSCKLGDQRIGISVLCVQEVLPLQEVTPVPKSHSSIAGLLNLRGQIVTAIDLRKRLEIVNDHVPKKPMYVIVKDEDEYFSLLVDEVGEVLEIAQSRFSKSPVSLDECWKKCCEGVCQLTTGLLIALDVSKIIDIAQDRKLMES